MIGGRDYGHQSVVALEQHCYRVYFVDRLGCEFHRRVAAVSSEMAVFCAMRDDRASGGNNDIRFTRIERE